MVAYFLGIMLFGIILPSITEALMIFSTEAVRFAWWLITVSIVATGVGSHSFVKYSAKGFEYGLSSPMTYMNDWFLCHSFFSVGFLLLFIQKSDPFLNILKKDLPNSKANCYCLPVIIYDWLFGNRAAHTWKSFHSIASEAFTILGMTIPVH